MWTVTALLANGDIKTIEAPTKGSAYEIVNVVAHEWEQRPAQMADNGAAIALKVEDGYGWNILTGDTAH